LSFRQLGLGPRLTVGFASIVVAMLAGNLVLLWQFYQVRTQADRLSGIDQELIVVLQAHTSLMSFYERLDALAHFQDTDRLVSEAERLQSALIEDNRRSRAAFGRLPPGAVTNPALLPMLEAIQGPLPEQLEEITALARAKDWGGVRLRLDRQVRPLESRIAVLAANTDREVAEQRGKALESIQQARRRVFLITPITALVTMVFAGLLGLTITRSITQPLGKLMEASKALGRGEFEHRVAIAGADELARLGRVFNETAGTLRELYEAVSTREAYLAEAERLSQTGSFGWNLATGELVWSDETFRIFECDRTSKPTVDLVLARTHPDDRAQLQHLVQQASSSGTDWDIEHRLLMPDGAVKHVRAVAHAVRDSSGRPGFVGAVMNLTERKRAEEALRHAQASLAHVTRVTTLGEMAASIAHEINQPLAAATTDSSTCLRWLARDPANVDEARLAATRTVKDVTRAVDIIKRVRALFRRGTPQREPVDVNDMIREMIVLMRNDAERFSISIRSELAADLPTVMADRVQLQQVVMNLMVNGVEAMKGRGGPGELTLQSQRSDGDQLLVSVSDTGVGLGSTSGDEIFQAFFTTKADGTGMGLAISRSIIESHGGRLWAAANQERGATFHFTVPRDGDASE
jgi:signal transduction histidine kinase/HAMP domain-containing protein